MANDILYDLTPWEEAPSTLTPINAENLNARDSLLKKVVDKTNQLQEQISDLETDMENVGKPTDEQVKTAVTEYLQDNDIDTILNSNLIGKRLSVLGTSISTYPNTIPEGYVSYYTVETMPSVNDMWWKKLCDSLGMTMLINNSYSGSCVAKKSDTTIPSGSETVRNMALHDGENAPDIIIVEMGANDFLTNVSIGNYAVSSGTVFDSYTFKGAYAKMLWNMMCKYPNTKIYCATIMPLYQGTDGNPFPTSKTGGGIEAYNNVIKDVADMFGIEILDFSKCGITTKNLVNYTVDGRIHPNADGQTLMANFAEEVLLKYKPVLASYIDDTVTGDSTGGEDSGGDSGEEGGGDSGGSTGTLLHSFDFTKGEITDSVGGLAVTPSLVTTDTNGALFSSNKSEIDVNDGFKARGKTYILEFGDMDGSALATTSFYHTYKVFTMGGNTFRANYFIWDTDANKWGWYAAANEVFSFDGTVNELSNGTLKIVVEDDGTAKIYFNDVLKYESPKLITETAYLGIGASDSTFNQMTVKKFEIYSNA